MAIINMWSRKSNSHERFDLLMRPHLQKLYRLAYRLTGQQHDAEDLVQDVVLKLFPRLDEMTSIEKLGPWLSKVLYRHYIDKIRSQNRSPLQLVEDSEELYQSSEADTPQPSDEAESELTMAALKQAVDRLNEDQRQLVILHDIEGFTLQEIHEMQGVSVGTLKSRLSRAREKLKEYLKKLEPFHENERVNM